MSSTPPPTPVVTALDERQVPVFRTEREDWVLLEANTGPQMGWLEAATGAPMVAAMATMLAKGTA